MKKILLSRMGRRTKNLIHCARNPSRRGRPQRRPWRQGRGCHGGESPFQPERDKAQYRLPAESKRDSPGCGSCRRKSVTGSSRENPDYGVIICRCEEISKGEILDARNSPLPVCTVDGVLKKRPRPGMGRCQGGFWMPLVAQIISEHEGIPLSRAKKSGTEAVISYGPTKG